MLRPFQFAVLLLQEAQPEKSGGISGWGIFGLILLGLFILLAIIGYFTGVQRRLKAALAAKAAGNMEKAEKLFLKILADEGADYIKNLSGDALTQTKQAFAQAHLELGEIHQTRGEKSSAVEHYKKAAAAGFELSPRAVGFLGEAYAAENDTSEAAINVYVHYIKLRPQDKVSAKVYSVLESACRVEESQKAAKRKAAVELNERVLNANPKVDWAHYYLGLAAFLEKNIEKAGTHFAKAQALKPDRAMTYYWLGVCKLRGKKPDLPAATKSFDTFLGYKSEDPKFLKRQGRAAHELGMAFVESLGGFSARPAQFSAPQQETLERANAYLQTSVERDTSNAEYWFHLGRLQSQRGAPEQAIASLESATRLAPEKPEYFFHLGAECVVVQRLEPAANALRKAVELKKDDAEARALLAGVCLRINEFAEAETQCRELVKLRQNVPGDLAMLVRALYHQERHADVVQEIESRPDCKVTADVSADAVFCIGHSYLRVDQPSKALIWFESVPKNPRSLFNFACALAHAGLYDHAHTKLDDLFENPAEFAVRGHLLRANV
ncbi:MAG TPA: tetratricopeptide repeat protein, partial [Candidatus Nitrosotenuis sp.]|nr:tetratricopeptide repeat protein [Candidatus Nitrosotenuis sp.]